MSLVHHGGYPIKLLILPQIIARFGSSMHPEPVDNTEHINTKTSNKMVLQNVHIFKIHILVCKVTCIHVHVRCTVYMVNKMSPYSNSNYLSSTVSIV